MELMIRKRDGDDDREEVRVEDEEGKEKYESLVNTQRSRKFTP